MYKLPESGLSQNPITAADRLLNSKLNPNPNRAWRDSEQLKFRKKYQAVSGGCSTFLLYALPALNAVPNVRPSLPDILQFHSIQGNPEEHHGRFSERHQPTEETYIRNGMQ
ncbi:hypothetical protein AUQ37_08830 [Candidatus Methanomethylophilus sp. 1R26]|nr:hypothetical protein AUQ37_08830 [Candidatus Methanomethylophilus sp. 1R26]